MAYTELIPNMAFRNDASPSSLASASAEEHSVMVGMTVRRLMVHITTAVVSSGNVVVTFYKRSAPGVSAAQVTLGTIVIPPAALVGSVYYKDIESPDFTPGQALFVQVTTVAAGGGAAGAGMYGANIFHREEAAPNVSAMIASA